MFPVSSFDPSILNQSLFLFDSSVFMMLGAIAGGAAFYASNNNSRKKKKKRRPKLMHQGARWNCKLHLWQKSQEISARSKEDNNGSDKDKEGLHRFYRRGQSLPQYGFAKES